jgi:hypothetical protein
MAKDITLLEEIAEQDFHQVVGGTGLTLTAPTTLTMPVYSWYRGNQGVVCTVTKECGSISGC